MKRSIKNSFAIFRLVFQTDRVSKIGRFVVGKKKGRKYFLTGLLAGSYIITFSCNLELQLEQKTCCKQVHEIISRFNNETWD